MVETKKMPQQIQKKMFSISLAKKNCKSVGKIAYSVMSFCSLSLCTCGVVGYIMEEGESLYMFPENNWQNTDR